MAGGLFLERTQYCSIIGTQLNSALTSATATTRQRPTDRPLQCVSRAWLAAALQAVQLHVSLCVSEAMPCWHTRTHTQAKCRIKVGAIQRCSPEKKKWGTSETRLRQRFLNSLGLHRRTLIHVRKILPQRIFGL